jgi:tripartite-type tricarboxylate transporter receptor subunit TctC
MLVLTAAWMGLALRAAEAADETTFKGETITILIGYGVGGGYDVYGRLASRFLGKYLPGTPNVIAQNRTGAGSLAAANYIYSVAPKDGTVLGVIGQTIPVDQLFDPTGKRFESAKFTWIGRMAAGVEAIVAWHTASVNSIADARTVQMAVAAAGPASGSAIYPTVLNNLLGTKFNVVIGYAGTSEMLNAMERRETDGVGSVNVSTLTSQFGPWLRDKAIHLLTQVALERHPLFPDVPTFAELGQTEDQKKILSVFAMSGDIGRALLAPPDIPPERARALRTAFMQMMSDPELIAFAKTAQIDISPMEGSALQRLVEDIGRTPKPIIARAKEAMTSRR